LNFTLPSFTVVDGKRTHPRNPKAANQMKIKSVEVEYIESGTFQGGEEDVFKAKIEYGETCYVVSKSTLDYLKDCAWKYEELSK